jgi:hypothetical protein
MQNHTNKTIVQPTFTNGLTESTVHSGAQNTRWGKEKMNKQKKVIRGLVAFTAVTLGILFLASGFLGTAEAATAPALRTAANFAVLAGSTVTNTGATTVNGNLGVSPGTAVVGFPPGVVIPPSTIQVGNAVAGQAKTNLTAAYNQLAGQTCNVNLTGQDLGGLTLTPGVYCFPSTSAQLTGTVTLDAQGHPNAVFVFQIGSTLITAGGASVNVINGASGCNIYWQVGSSATLGTGTSFKGNILANASITLSTGANIAPGRALARTAAVTMDTNNVTMAGCAAAVATATPPAPTRTAIAATQTAIVPTLTAIAATQTAVAATQTAVAPTPTRTATPLACTDTVRPTGFLSGTGTDSQGHNYIQITSRDIGSGIATIVITKSINAVTVVAGFVPGTTQPVVTTSTKINAAKSSVVELRITDLCGNFVLADPVLTLLSLDNGTRTKQTFKAIPAFEHFVTVTNSAAGIKRLDLQVNGKTFSLKKLKNNELRLLDIGAAMTKESNRVVLIGTGKEGGSAFIIIGDSFLEQPEALTGFTQAHAQAPQENLSWGQTE